MSQNKVENIREWIEAINSEGRGLTKWERDFMESITEQFIDPTRPQWHGSLSERQEEILEWIYAEKTP